MEDITKKIKYLNSTIESAKKRIEIENYHIKEQLESIDKVRAECNHDFKTIAHGEAHLIECQICGIVEGG